MRRADQRNTHQPGNDEDDDYYYYYYGSPFIAARLLSSQRRCLPDEDVKNFTDRPGGKPEARKWKATELAIETDGWKLTCKLGWHMDAVEIPRSQKCQDKKGYQSRTKALDFSDHPFPHVFPASVL